VSDTSILPPVRTVQPHQRLCGPGNAIGEQQKLTSALCSTSTSLAPGADHQRWRNSQSPSRPIRILARHPRRVNATNTGVNATIVNDGSANGYRLVITARIVAPTTHQHHASDLACRSSTMTRQPGVFDPQSNAQAGMTNCSAADAKLV